ncbi:MAG TPA: N-acetyltransferase [Longimicrobium sp.]|jgi:amino-acid N-acetyltransferase|nr:N-acetyltransferase [Longimicrobium sp.]
MLVQIAPPAFAKAALDLPPFDATGPVYVRPATIADMLQVEPMINGFAAQNLMLPKTREQLVRLFREFVVAADEHGRVVGCGGLRIFSPTLAEVISLAVDPVTQGTGIGGRIVERLVEDAEMLGISTVFALTLRDGFFHRLGFRTVPKEMFPAKVWSDCRNCPKLTACDEIAVVREVRETPGAAHWE